MDEPLIVAFETVYRSHAPEVTQVWAMDRQYRQVQGHGKSDRADPFANNEAYSSVDTRTYRWQNTLSADEWMSDEKPY